MMTWLVSLFRRILDALSAPFRPLELPERTDAEALASDWQAVGGDLRQAMAKFESEVENSVSHRPTGERWLVACVRDDRLSWVGWPEGSANLADCELVRKASPESRRKLLEEMAAMGGSDHRQRYAAWRLKEDGNL